MKISVFWDATRRKLVPTRIFDMFTAFKFKFNTIIITSEYLNTTAQAVTKN